VEVSLQLLLADARLRFVSRKHVTQDLQPYICTFENCSTPNKTYGSHHEWFAHEAHVHRVQWTCQECRQYFDSKSAFTEHRKHQHPSADQPLSVLLDMCSRPADESCMGTCSLCFSEVKQLRKHMGRHMLFLALFTLPRRDAEEPVDGESDEGQAGASEEGKSVADDRETFPDSDIMSEISDDPFKETDDASQTQIEQPNFNVLVEGVRNESARLQERIVKEQDDDFWDRAYEISSNTDLWVFYEGIIIEELEGRASPAVFALMNGSQRDEMMSAVVLKKAGIIEEATWDSKLNHSIESRRIVAAILLVRDQLASKVSTQPHTALAWAGMCILLQSTLDPKIESAAELGLFDKLELEDGLSYISVLITRLTVIQRLYSEHDTDPGLSVAYDEAKLKAAFETQMSKVCSQILTFQAQAVYQICQKGFLRLESPLPLLLNDLKTTVAALGSSSQVVDSDDLKSALREHELFIDEILRLQRMKWQKEEPAIEKARGEASTHVPTRQEANTLAMSLKECLQALRTSAYEMTKDQISSRSPGTCQWLLKKSSYRKWLENRSSKVLWIYAGAGYGKSVLMKSLVDVELRSTAIVTTCYFFFMDDGTERRSATHAVSALLHQLCNRNHALLEKANEAFRLNGAKMTQSFQWLWDLLLSLAQRPEAGTVICFLDALDECEDTGRKDLISSLTKLQSDKSGAIDQLKFLVASDPVVAIDRRSDTSLVCQFGDDEMGVIKREIDFVIRDRVPRIAAEKALDQELQSVLQARLLQNPNPNHLWLRLTLAAVEQAAGITGSKQMSRFIEELPKDVNAACKALLKLSPQPEQASKVLHILVAAVRPLTLREMNMALNVRGGQKARDDVHLRPERGFAAYIDNLCTPIFGVFQGKVCILHQKIKEWWAPRMRMTQHPPQLDASARDLVQSSRASRSDRILTDICLNYLLFDVFKVNTIPIDTMEKGAVRSSYQHRQSRILQYAQSHDFLEYAAMHWIEHFRSMGEHSSDLMERWKVVCELQSDRFYIWFRIFWYGHGIRNNLDSTLKIPDFTLLSLACFLGDFTVVRHLVERGEDLETKKGQAWPPLLAAINRGHTRIAVFLIEHGASVKSEGIQNWTPLGLAATKGLEEITRYLIENGAEVEQRTYPLGVTALIRASGAGKLTTVETLLSNGAGVNTESNNDQTPLMAASKGGHQAVVEILIWKGADVQACDLSEQSALHHATIAGHDGIAQMLLDHGAEADTMDEHERTPLSWAAQRGLCVTTTRLIEKGAELNGKDEEGFTPLAYATCFGHLTIAEMLVDAGADVNAPLGQSEQTALSYAVDLRNHGMIRMLLNLNADPNHFDSTGRTALVHAIQLKDHEITKTLLEAGADPNIPDEHGLTALTHAVHVGWAFLVNLLLEAGADPNISDDNGGTALSYVPQSDQTTIGMLVEAGAHRD